MGTERRQYEMEGEREVGKERGKEKGERKKVCHFIN